jgi:hypothetical protein
MSAGANDPHGDIDELSEGLAVALLMMDQAGLIELPEDLMRSAGLRMAALDGDEYLAALNAAAKVMARNRVTH